MLCPSCGFISFDHVPACVKCRHSLADLTGQLRGTAVQTMPLFFLGSVVSIGTSGPPEPPPQEQMTEPSTPAFGDMELSLASAAPLEMETLPGEDATIMLQEESPEELHLELKDAGALDMSEIEAAEREASPEIALRLEMPGGDGLQDDTANLDMGELGEGLELSLEGLEPTGQDLSLESESVVMPPLPEEEPAPALAFVPEPEEMTIPEVDGVNAPLLELEPLPALESMQAEQIQADLEKIDLSDLVPSQGKRSKKGKSVPEQASPSVPTSHPELATPDALEGSIEFRLDSFSSEGQGPPPSDSDTLDLDFSGSETINASELEPIDLTLDDDEAILDLSLSPSTTDKKE